MSFFFSIKKNNYSISILSFSFKLLQSFCDPIVNKPKPKVEPPKDVPKEQPATEGAAAAANAENPEQQQNGTAEGTQPSTEKTTENMETETPKQQTSEGAKPENLDMEVD